MSFLYNFFYIFDIVWYYLTIVCCYVVISVIIAILSIWIVHSDGTDCLNQVGITTTWMFTIWIRVWCVWRQIANEMGLLILAGHAATIKNIDNVSALTNSLVFDVPLTVLYFIKCILSSETSVNKHWVKWNCWPKNHANLF